MDQKTTRMTTSQPSHDHDDHHDAPASGRDHDHSGHDHSGHDHSGHDHSGHGHPHAHGSGLLGWIQDTFAHSHDVADQIDDAMASSERGAWATKWALVSLGLTTVLQFVIVYFSGSAALLADTVHNLGDAANSIPLLIAFALQRRVRSRQFTYGYGRMEDVAGLVIVLTIAISAAVAGWESVRALVDPEPMTHLGWVALAALIGFAGNEAVAILQIRTGRRIGSAALVADGQHARIDGLTSLAVLIAVAGTVLGAPILDPIVGLVITATILLILRSASVAIFRRMLDGIEPPILAAVEHAPLHVEGVRAVRDARARWLGHAVRADLELVVDRELSLADVEALTTAVHERLREHVPAFGGAMITVAPDSQPGPRPTTI